MGFKISVGIEKENTLVVSEKDTALVYGSGLLDVYATPAMIAFMESTAHCSILPFLPKECTSVGIEINVKHLKATPIGGKLTCKSELINIEGKHLTFKVNVYDVNGIVGEAIHVRYIVEIERFMSKLV